MDGDQPTPVSGTLLVDPLELGGIGETRASAEPHGLDAELLAPLTPARGYYPPATYGLHPLAETVGLGTLATIGLVCTLHMYLR